MVDPKKDYELLMRYLQGGAPAREPAAVPEEADHNNWQPTPQPANATAAPTIYAPETALRVPRRQANKKPVSLHWPKFKIKDFRKSARFATAGFAIIILSIAVWKGYEFYQLSAEKIYTTLYVPFDIKRFAQPAEKNTIAQYYTAGNFVAATLQSKKQPVLSELEKLLTGLAYMHRGDYSKATKWLEPAANNFKSPYRQQAEFYAALAYLKNEDYDRSIEKLEHIYFNPAHLYYSHISQGTIRDIKMLKWR